MKPTLPKYKKIQKYANEPVAFHLHKTRNFFERLDGITEATATGAEMMAEMRAKVDGFDEMEAELEAEKAAEDARSPLMKGMLSKKADKAKEANIVFASPSKKKKIRKGAKGSPELAKITKPTPVPEFLLS